MPPGMLRDGPPASCQEAANTVTAASAGRHGAQGGQHRLAGRHDEGDGPGEGEWKR